MYFSILASGLLAAGLASASPIAKRNHIIYPPKVDDGIILNYALTLEYLERKFYRGGLEKLSHEDFVHAGFADPFYENLKEIYVDEKAHVAFLSTALTAAKVTPTVELKYCFPYTDAASFVTLSSVLEGVGVSAYLGAAASIAEPAYVTAAGAILTIEARHSAYIRKSLGQSPFPAPFDTPVGFNQVYSLAAKFICGGTSPVALPFQAFPDLNLECSQYYYESGRSPVTFTNAYAAAAASGFKVAADTPVFAVFYSGLQKYPVKVRITRGNKDYKIDAIPAGIAGQVYVVLSLSEMGTSDENIIAGPAILEVYPKGCAPKEAKAKCH